MEYTEEKKGNLIQYSVYLACLLSILSQIPYFVRTGSTQKVAFPGWIILLVSLVLSTKKIVIRRRTTPVYLYSIALMIWLLMDTAILGNNLFASSMIYCYMISMFIFFLGAWSSDYISDRVLNKIVLIYILSSVIVSAFIFFQYFGLGYRLTTRFYAYRSKNSVSQILFTAIILLVVKINPQKTIVKAMKIAGIGFLLWQLLLLRSRATFVSLALCVIVIVFSKSSSKKVRAFVAVVCICAIVFLFLNPRVFDYMVNNVLLAGRSINNLNDLTSGRVTIISSFPELIKGHWFTGVGARYYECFPLSAILQFGIAGGILVIIISLLPLQFSFKYRKVSDEYFLLLLIALGYSVNGLFEGLTPFGPGVKCFYLWFYYGVLLNKSRIISDNSKIITD